MTSTLTDKGSGRRQYLITYSQANAEKFPTSESFGQMLEREFNNGKSDNDENAMMMVRWNVMTFKHQFKEKD